MISMNKRPCPSLPISEMRRAGDAVHTPNELDIVEHSGNAYRRSVVWRIATYRASWDSFKCSCAVS